MKKAYLKYFLALLFFGSNGVVASQIGLNSYEIVFLRSALGSFALIALFFLKRNKLTAFKYRRDLFLIALSGIAMATDWLFLFEAYKQIGVSLGMIINYTGPAMVMALSPFVFKEKITWHKTLSLLAAIIGVILISGQAATTGLMAWGLACAVLSAVSYTAMVIFNKMAEKVEGFENSSLQLFFTFLTVAIFLFIKQGFYMEIEASDCLPILWLGLINTGLSCYFYFSSIGKLPVQTVSVCGYIEPLSAVLLSVIFLGESLLPLQILGGALIIGGALFGELYGRKEG